MHLTHIIRLQLHAHTNGHAILVNATTLTNVDVNTGLQNIIAQTDAYNVSIDRFIIVNPLVTNGLSHTYHLDESIFIFRGFMSFFFVFFFIFTSFFDENCQQTE